MDMNQEHSLTSRVFQKIRNDILQGKYKEQDELKENTLGNELGVSRTPVREALRQLELEGLVAIIPNKGAYVTGINSKDVEDIYAIRTMLEGLCARWATENISEQQINELEETIILAEFYLKKDSADNIEQMVILDGKFHTILYEASNSRILSHILMDFHKYVQIDRKNSVISEERARKSIREHKQILRAIMDKDADLAEQLANNHMLQVMQNLKMMKHSTNYYDDKGED